MRKTIKKYQPGGNISGKVPKGVKVDTAGTIKEYRKIFNMPAKKTPSRKRDVDLSAPGKGMMEELKKKGAMPPSKKNIGRKGIKIKAKSGASFPDLNKDGKITKADILKGRGVIANSGSKIKKAQNGGQPVLKPSMTIKKSKLDSILNKRKASMDSTKADFNRRLEKAKTPKKMMGGGKCRGGCY